MTAARFLPPPPVEPVRNGTAEQLARVAHFREFEHVQPEELDAVAHFLIGNVGNPVDRDVLWAEIRQDCLTLWHLVTDDWSERDLDEIPEADWARYDFATGQQEIARRYEITRDRLCLEIESAVWLARYVAGPVCGRRVASQRNGGRVMAARIYQPVLGEITTALFACPDCGAVVWYSLRDKHDQLHEQIDGLIGTTWAHTELLDRNEQRLDEHADQIARLQNDLGHVESSVHRVADDVRDVGYRADDAKRAADDAARSTSRGW